MRSASTGSSLMIYKSDIISVLRDLEAAGANYRCTVSGYLLPASSIISCFTVECQQRTGYWCPSYICKLGENKCYSYIKYSRRCWYCRLSVNVDLHHCSRSSRAPLLTGFILTQLLSATSATVQWHTFPHLCLPTQNKLDMIIMRFRGR